MQEERASRRAAETTVPHEVPRLVRIRVPSAAAPPRPGLVAPVEAPFHGSAGFYARVALLGLVALLAAGVLVLRLWSLQVLHSVHYARVAGSQATRTSLSLPAPRGAIVDDRGRVLAETTGRLVVTADPDVLGAADARGAWQPNAEGRRMLAALARLSGTPVRALLARVRAGIARASPYGPVVVLPDPPEPLTSFLAERARSYPGLGVAAVPVRSYPLGGLGSEFLGLLGQRSPEQVARHVDPWAAPGVPVGQSGVEATYDRVLSGGSLPQRVAVDALGRPRGRARTLPPTRRARTLELTIDVRLQRAAVRALEDGIALAHASGHPDADAGAAVVMDPRTGAIDALASVPSFDQRAAASDPAYLSRLLRGQPSGPSPLLDLATQGVFPTGSAFKPIVAEAALAAGLITPTTELPCVGAITVGGVVFHNVESWIDTSLTLPQALQISCDTWFYQLGEQFYARQRRGSLDIQRWASLLGLGHPTGIDVPGESSGLVPTPAWLERTHHEPWYEGQSVNLSIGQGFLDVTPLQLAVAYAALANGGTLVRPHVGEAVIGPDGTRTPLSFPPVRHVALRDLNAIREGLYLAANAPGGTSASVFAGFPVPVAGKTGTAEAPPGSDHSWYASWAPAWNPKVVVVVVIEHGGFGAQAAAPAAREIYRAFFHLR